MKTLTARQREVLDAIRNYIAEKGYAPAIRELRPLLGISSLRGVTIHLDALEQDRKKPSHAPRALVNRANSA